jgi:hypothetical protein
MPEKPDDHILRRAREAEEKLRARVAVKPTALSTEKARDEAPDDWIALVEPDGTTNWGFRFLPEADDSFLGGEEARLSADIIDPLIRALPFIGEALRGGGVFELIGPKSVLNGLQNGTLELVPSKLGGVLGGVRNVGGGAVKHQARFREISLPSSIGPGLALSAASAVLGQLHMVEIREKLSRIEERLDRVLDGQSARRYGSVFGALETLQDVANTTSVNGDLSDVQGVRLAGADLALVQASCELNALQSAYHRRTKALSGAKLSALADALGSERSIALSDTRTHLACLSGLFVSQALLLEYAKVHEPKAATFRSAALDAARQKLRSFPEFAHHLRDLHAQCRSALNRESTRIVGYSSSTFERVSKALYNDRLAVSDLIFDARKLALRAEPPSLLRLVCRPALGPGVFVSALQDAGLSDRDGKEAWKK